MKLVISTFDNDKQMISTGGITAEINGKGPKVVEEIELDEENKEEIAKNPELFVFKKKKGTYKIVKK